MIAVLAIVLIATLIALFGWLGRPGLGNTVSRTVALAFPLIIVSAAATITDGLTVSTAVCSAVSVALGVVLASVLPMKGFATNSRPGTTAVVAMISTLVVLGLAVAMVGWSSFILTVVTGANRYVTIVALVVAATGFAAGGLGRTGVARVGMIAAIAAAALLLVAGLLLGTPGRAFDPVVPVDGPPLMKTLGYAVIIVILGAAHPGLRGIAATNRRKVAVGGIISGLIAAGILIGLVFLLGGSLLYPSWPLSIFNSYFPASIAVLVAGFITALCVSTVGETIDSSLIPWEGIDSAAGDTMGKVPSRPVLVVAVGTWTLVVSLLTIQVGAWVTALGVAALVALLLSALVRRSADSGAVSGPESSTINESRSTADHSSLGG